MLDDPDFDAILGWLGPSPPASADSMTSIASLIERVPAQSGERALAVPPLRELPKAQSLKAAEPPQPWRKTLAHRASWLETQARPPAVLNEKQVARILVRRQFKIRLSAMQAAMKDDETCKPHKSRQAHAQGRKRGPNGCFLSAAALAAEQGKRPKLTPQSPPPFSKRPLPMPPVF